MDASKHTVISRAHETLDYVSLGEARYRKMREFSMGMRQRVKLAAALIHDPPVLFLDEPTNGLDPRGRDEMLELVDDLGHHRGKSVLLSSHLLRDVEEVCDDILVLRRGSLAASGRLEELCGEAQGAFTVTIRGDEQAFADAIQLAGGTAKRRPSASFTWEVTPPAVTDGAREVMSIAIESGIQLRSIQRVERSLEEVFFDAVGSD